MPKLSTVFKSLITVMLSTALFFPDIAGATGFEGTVTTAGGGVVVQYSDRRLATEVSETVT